MYALGFMSALSPNSIVYGDGGGRYRVVRLLGEGGMSRVWLVEDLAGGRQVVIKEPKTEENADVNIEGLNREVEALRKLMGESLSEKQRAVGATTQSSSVIDNTHLVSTLIECFSDCEGLYSDSSSARDKCYEVCLRGFNRFVSAVALSNDNINALINDCKSFIGKVESLSKLCSDKVHKDAAQQQATTVSPETKPALTETRKLGGCSEYVVNLIDLAYLPDKSSLKFPVLEFVEGVSLKEFIQRQERIPWDVLRHLMYQLLYAMACVHSTGVVHRDIRPVNVVIDWSGRKVKLIDFSTAKFDYEEKDNWIVEASGGYTAPEQRLGKSSKGSDVYSLGAVLLFMSTGDDPEKLPRGIDDIVALIRRRVDGIGDEEVKKLLTFIGKAMNPEPQQRFRDAVEMARVFHEVFYEGKELTVQLPQQLQPYGVVLEGCRPVGKWFRVNLTIMLMRGGEYERYDEVEFEVGDHELIIIGRERHRGFVRVEKRSGAVYVLINDPYQHISRTHCQINWCNDGWFIRDVSQNGTWVINSTGKRIFLRGDPTRSTRLDDNDYLMLAYISQDQPYITILFKYQQV